jgi:hypothetical protein
MDVAIADAPPGTEDSITISAGIWWTAQTKTGEEIRLFNELRSPTDEHPYGIIAFLPLVQRRQHRFGKTQFVERPLFANYLFFAGGPMERYAALMTARTLSILMEPKQEQLVEDLESLRKAIAVNPKLGEYKGIRHGTKCEVVHGPYRGQIVTYTRKLSSKRGAALVVIRSLGRAVDLDIPEEFLEPI